MADKNPQLQQLHWTVDPDAPEPEVIREAARLIREGRLVAFPTETVYGLGADGLSSAAVERIFEAKGRPASNPVILHVLDKSDAAELVRGPLSPVAERLMDAFWPGPLTVVLPRNPRVPNIVTAGGDTVAVRAPAHPVARALIEASGCPIAAPSANRSMGISPTTAQHVVRSLGERVDGILDGGRCNVGLESTVCAVVDGRVEILRPGGVTREMLREAGFELVEMQQAQGASDQSNETLRSPGQLSKHYAPGTPLVVLDGSATAVRDELESFRGSKIALLAERRTLDIIAASDRVEEFPLGEDSKTAEYARHLYGQLHAADASTADVIIAVVPPAEHMGEAIRDRLRRASSEWRTLE